MPRGTINTNLAAYFPYSCLIESASTEIDDYGDQIETWSEFTTADAALGVNLSEEETQSRQETIIWTHNIILNGSYAVTEKMRATIDSVIYDVIAVQYTEVKSDNLDLEFTHIKAKKAQ